MPLRPPSFPPTTQRDYDQWCRAIVVTPDPGSVTTDKIVDHAVTDAKLSSRASACVMGRPQATPGNAQDITSGFDDTFLLRRSGTLSFGFLVDTDIPATIARDTEVATAITVFNALPDPFTQYYNTSRGDARYQLLPLTGTATYDPPSLATLIGATTTVTVTGAVLGQGVIISFSLDLQGIQLTGYVSAANTVTARFFNSTAGTLDLASGTLKTWVFT